MRVRGVLGVAVVVAVVMTAGCTPDEPEPTPTSSGPTSSAATTEPTTSTPAVAVPELPEAATVGDAAGAETFVKHWVDVLNYAYATGDTELVKALSSDDCTTCDDTYAVIDARREAGATLEAGLLKVDLVRAPPPEDGLALVSAQAVQEVGNEISSNGTSTSIPATPPGNLGFVLRFGDSAWSLEGIGNE